MNIKIEDYIKVHDTGDSIMDSAFKLEVNDLIIANPDCNNDMEGVTALVIEAIPEGNLNKVKIKILKNECQRRFIDFGRVNQVKDLSYMSGHTHSRCSIFRLNKILNWRERLK